MARGPKVALHPVVYHICVNIVNFTNVEQISDNDKSKAHDHY